MKSCCSFSADVSNHVPVGAQGLQSSFSMLEGKLAESDQIFVLRSTIVVKNELHLLKYCTNKFEVFVPYLSFSILFCFWEDTTIIGRISNNETLYQEKEPTARHQQNELHWS